MLTHGAGIPSGSDFSLDHNNLGWSWSWVKTTERVPFQKYSTLMEWSRAFGAGCVLRRACG